MEQFLSAYQKTIYWFELSHETTPIRVGEYCPMLEFLLKKKHVTHWAYMTGYNPQSKRVPEQENERRHNRLVRELAEMGYEMYPGHTEAEDGNWEPERSVLVLGIPLKIAVALAEKYDQNAILAGEFGGKPKLVFCNSSAPQKTNDTASA